MSAPWPRLKRIIDGGRGALPAIFSLFRTLRAVPADAESPLRAELFSSELMAQHGKALAATHVLAAGPCPNQLLTRLANGQVAPIMSASASSTRAGRRSSERSPFAPRARLDPGFDGTAPAGSPPWCQRAAECRRLHRPARAVQRRRRVGRRVRVAAAGGAGALVREERTPEAAAGEWAHALARQCRVAAEELDFLAPWLAMPAPPRGAGSRACRPTRPPRRGRADPDPAGARAARTRMRRGDLPAAGHGIARIPAIDGVTASLAGRTEALARDRRRARSPAPGDDGSCRREHRVELKLRREARAGEQGGVSASSLPALPRGVRVWTRAGFSG